ncbi:neurotrypsin-like [Babylonia areolata]|uniref:neurotrypsin-like n=1 Tax=Babylonia areolata TaxID=304850 RepID=UPI003FD42D5A
MNNLIFVALWVLSFIGSSAGQNQYDLRLVDGGHIDEGRVEIYYNSEWGTVCDDSWDTLDAQVVCRQLGLSTSSAVAYSYAHFGAGSYFSSTFLDEVQCTGTETSLYLCPANPWGDEDCSHSEDASVSCDSGTYTNIRLVDGTVPWEGRVEVERNGRWGIVCDDQWDDLDAAVVCQQLGYDPTDALALSYAAFGQGTGPIMMDETACVGTEANLWDCPYGGYSINDCSPSEAAAVVCSAPPTTTPTMIATTTTTTTVNGGIIGAVLEDVKDNLFTIYIAVGVGVPLFIILCIILCVCCCKKTSNRVSFVRKPVPVAVPVAVARPPPRPQQVQLVVKHQGAQHPGAMDVTTYHM